MRNTLLTILACLIPLFCEGQISKEAFERWHDNKYSMFIHFGLYSELGGVWDGKPITEMELGFKERMALSMALDKIKGTDIEKLLKEYKVI